MDACHLVYSPVHVAHWYFSTSSSVTFSLVLVCSALNFTQFLEAFLAMPTLHLLHIYSWRHEIHLASCLQTLRCCWVLVGVGETMTLFVLVHCSKSAILLSRYAVCFFFLTFLIQSNFNLTKSNILFYYIPTADIKKTFSERLVSFLICVLVGPTLSGEQAQLAVNLSA